MKENVFTTDFTTKKKKNLNISSNVQKILRKKLGHLGQKL